MPFFFLSDTFVYEILGHLLYLCCNHNLSPFLIGIDSLISAGGQQNPGSVNQHSVLRVCQDMQTDLGLLRSRILLVYSLCFVYIGYNWSCYQFSLPTTFLSRQVAMCTALVCRAQCSMPVRLCHWQSQTSNVCSRMTGQWSDRSATSSHKTLPPSGSVSYCKAWHWRPGPHPEGEKALLVWTRGMLQLCSQVSMLHTGWWKAWAWETQDGSSWQGGIAESGIHDRHTWKSGVRLPCLQQAS